MKRAIPALGIVLLLVGLGLRYGPMAVEQFDLSTGGKIDMAVVVYESKNQPVAEVDVMGGKTSQALRKAGKWRAYDQNEIPDKLKPTLDPIVAKLGVPCLTLIRGTKVAASAKLPPTDAELAAYVAKKGGY